MKSNLPVFLWMSLYRIIVRAPSIPHFRGLSMRNLHYEISICQKFIVKPQWHCQLTLIFNESHVTYPVLMYGLFYVVFFCHFQYFEDNPWCFIYWLTLKSHVKALLSPYKSSINWTSRCGWTLNLVFFVLFFGRITYAGFPAGTRNCDKLWRHSQAEVSYKYQRCSDAGRWKICGVQVVQGEQNLPILVGIGLTDLQNIGGKGGTSPPAPSQFWYHCFTFNESMNV